jgi:hypothetical protein
LSAFNEASAEISEADSAPPMSGEKLASVMDWLKPGNDEVSSQSHAAMCAAGVGPYEGKEPPSGRAPAPGEDTSIDDSIRAAKARDDEAWIKSKADDLRKVSPGKADDWYRSEARKRLKDSGG